jgi:PEP-CTERM motif-containing protein
MKAVSTIAACMLMALASAAQAGLVTVTAGTGTIQTPPGTLTINSIESDSAVFIWQESSQTLGASRTIASDAQTINGSTVVVSNTSAAVAGTLGAGTYVASFYAHYDPTTAGGASTSVTFTFSDLILGADLTSTQLGGGGFPTGDQLFSDGTVYSLGGSPRGLNFGADVMTISADRLSITLNLNATGGDTIDGIRIFVNPEPGTWALFGLGGLGLAFLSRRRKRRIVSA